MNLTEWPAADRQKILSLVCVELGFGPGNDPSGIWSTELSQLSGLKQSFAIAQWLSQRIKLGDDSWRLLSSHESDIVREWAAIIVGLSDEITFARKLAWVKPFADDTHSGIREIAWLALRAQVTSDPIAAINALVPWTGSRNERLRRYACEITRPRGVWSSPISMLAENPEVGLPILEPLRSDDSNYVKNSVGNWLNDASKSQPEWVRATAKRWREESPSIHTQYIVQRRSEHVGREWG